MAILFCSWTSQEFKTITNLFLLNLLQSDNQSTDSFLRAISI